MDDKAALLGVAVARETRRLLRVHLKPAEVAADGTVLLEVPYPDAVVLQVVLDVAADCFREPPQAALDSVLRLAG